MAAAAESPSSSSSEEAEERGIAGGGGGAGLVRHNHVLRLDPEEVVFTNIRLHQWYTQAVLVQNPLDAIVSFTITPGTRSRYDVQPVKMTLGPGETEEVLIHLKLDKPLRKVPARESAATHEFGHRDIFHIKSTFFQQKFFALVYAWAANPTTPPVPTGPSSTSGRSPGRRWSQTEAKTKKTKKKKKQATAASPGRKKKSHHEHQSPQRRTAANGKRSVSFAVERRDDDDDDGGSDGDSEQPRRRAPQPTADVATVNQSLMEEVAELQRALSASTERNERLETDLHALERKYAAHLPEADELIDRALSKERERQERLNEKVLGILQGKDKEIAELQPRAREADRLQKELDKAREELEHVTERAEHATAEVEQLRKRIADERAAEEQEARERKMRNYEKTIADQQEQIENLIAVLSEEKANTARERQLRLSREQVVLSDSSPGLPSVLETSADDDDDDEDDDDDDSDGEHQVTPDKDSRKKKKKKKKTAKKAEKETKRKNGSSLLSSSSPGDPASPTSTPPREQELQARVDAANRRSDELARRVDELERLQETAQRTILQSERQLEEAIADANQSKSAVGKARDQVRVFQDRLSALREGALGPCKAVLRLVHAVAPGAPATLTQPDMLLHDPQALSQAEKTHAEAVEQLRSALDGARVQVARQREKLAQVQDQLYHKDVEQQAELDELNDELSELKAELSVQATRNQVNIECLEQSVNALSVRSDVHRELAIARDTLTQRDVEHAALKTRMEQALESVSTWRERYDEMKARWEECVMTQQRRQRPAHHSRSVTDDDDDDDDGEDDGSSRHNSSDDGDTILRLSAVVEKQQRELETLRQGQGSKSMHEEEEKKEEDDQEGDSHHHDNDVTDSNREVRALREQLATAENALLDATHQHTVETDTMRDAHAKRLAEVRQEADALVRQVEGLQRNELALQRQVRELQKDVAEKTAALRKREHEATATAEKLDTARTAQMHRANALEDEVARLRSTLAEKAAQVAVLLDTIDGLQAESGANVAFAEQGVALDLESQSDLSHTTGTPSMSTPQKDDDKKQQQPSSSSSSSSSSPSQVLPPQVTINAPTVRRDISYRLIQLAAQLCAARSVEGSLSRQVYRLQRDLSKSQSALRREQNKVTQLKQDHAVQAERATTAEKELRRTRSSVVSLEDQLSEQSAEAAALAAALEHERQAHAVVQKRFRTLSDEASASKAQLFQTLREERVRNLHDMFQASSEAPVDLTATAARLDHIVELLSAAAAKAAPRGRPRSTHSMLSSSTKRRKPKSRPGGKQRAAAADDGIADINTGSGGAAAAEAVSKMRALLLRNEEELNKTRRRELEAQWASTHYAEKLTKVEAMCSELAVERKLLTQLCQALEGEAADAHPTPTAAAQSTSSQPLVEELSETRAALDEVRAELAAQTGQRRVFEAELKRVEKEKMLLESDFASQQVRNQAAAEQAVAEKLRERDEALKEYFTAHIKEFLLQPPHYQDVPPRAVLASTSTLSVEAAIKLTQTVCSLKIAEQWLIDQMNNLRTENGGLSRSLDSHKVALAETEKQLERMRELFVAEDSSAVPARAPARRANARVAALERQVQDMKKQLEEKDSVEADDDNGGGKNKTSARAARSTTRKTTKKRGAGGGIEAKMAELRVTLENTQAELRTKTNVIAKLRRDLQSLSKTKKRKNLSKMLSDARVEVAVLEQRLAEALDAEVQLREQRQGDVQDDDKDAEINQLRLRLAREDLLVVRRSSSEDAQALADTVAEKTRLLDEAREREASLKETIRNLAMSRQQQPQDEKQQQRSRKTATARRRGKSATAAGDGDDRGSGALQKSVLHLSRELNEKEEQVRLLEQQLADARRRAHGSHRHDRHHDDGDEDNDADESMASSVASSTAVPYTVRQSKLARLCEAVQDEIRKVMLAQSSPALDPVRVHHRLSLNTTITQSHFDDLRHLDETLRSASRRLSDYSRRIAAALVELEEEDGLAGRNSNDDDDDDDDASSRASHDKDDDDDDDGTQTDQLIKHAELLQAALEKQGQQALEQINALQRVNDGLRTTMKDEHTELLALRQKQRHIVEALVPLRQALGQPEEDKQADGNEDVVSALAKLHDGITRVTVAKMEVDGQAKRLASQAEELKASLAALESCAAEEKTLLESERDTARADANKWRDQAESVQHERDAFETEKMDLALRLNEKNDEVQRLQSLYRDTQADLHRRAQAYKADMEEAERRSNDRYTRMEDNYAGKLHEVQTAFEGQLDDAVRTGRELEVELAKALQDAKVSEQQREDLQQRLHTELKRSGEQFQQLQSEFENFRLTQRHVVDVFERQIRHMEDRFVATMTRQNKKCKKKDALDAAALIRELAECRALSETMRRENEALRAHVSVIATDLDDDVDDDGDDDEELDAVPARLSRRSKTASRPKTKLARGRAKRTTTAQSKKKTKKKRVRSAPRKIQSAIKARSQQQQRKATTTKKKKGAAKKRSKSSCEQRYHEAYVPLDDMADFRNATVLTGKISNLHLELLRTQKEKELSDMEVETLQTKLKTMEDQLRARVADVDELRRKLKKEHAREADVERERRRERKAAKAYADEARQRQQSDEELQQTVAEYKSASKLACEELERKSNYCEALKRKCEALSDEVEKNKAEVASKTAKLDKLQSQLHARDRTLSQIKEQSVQLDKKRDELDRLQERLDASQAKLREAQSQVARRDVTIHDLKTRLERLRERSSDSTSLGNKVESLRSQIRRAKNDLQRKTHQVALLKDKLEAVCDEHKDCPEREASLSDQVKELQSKLQRVQSRLRALKKKKEEEATTKEKDDDDDDDEEVAVDDDDHGDTADEDTHRVLEQVEGLLLSVALCLTQKLDELQTLDDNKENVGGAGPKSNTGGVGGGLLQFSQSEIESLADDVSSLSTIEAEDDDEEDTPGKQAFEMVKRCLDDMTRPGGDEHSVQVAFDALCTVLDDVCALSAAQGAPERLPEKLRRYELLIARVKKQIVEQQRQHAQQVRDLERRLQRAGVRKQTT